MTTTHRWLWRSAVAVVVSGLAGMAVAQGYPVKSVKDLIALARAKPGTLSYASIGTGTPQHFAGELMKTTFRIDMVHVPYKGAAPALIDIVGSSAEALGNRQKTDIDKYRKIAAAAGITPE